MRPIGLSPDLPTHAVYWEQIGTGMSEAVNQERGAWRLFILMRVTALTEAGQLEVTCTGPLVLTSAGGPTGADPTS